MTRTWCGSRGDIQLGTRGNAAGAACGLCSLTCSSAGILKISAIPPLSRGAWVVGTRPPSSSSSSLSGCLIPPMIRRLYFSACVVPQHIMTALLVRAPLGGPRPWVKKGCCDMGREGESRPLHVGFLGKYGWEKHPGRVWCADVSWETCPRPGKA